MKFNLKTKIIRVLTLGGIYSFIFLIVDKLIVRSTREHSLSELVVQGLLFGILFTWLSYQNDTKNK